MTGQVNVDCFFWAERWTFSGFYGDAKAAERSGDRKEARSYYERLVGLCSYADTERPELVEAKKYLARK